MTTRHSPLGMGIVAVPAGLIATGLLRAIKEERAEARRTEEQAEGARKQDGGA